MRGPLLALAAGLAFLGLTIALAWRLYDVGPDTQGYAFLGPIAFAIIGAGLLIAFFIWLRSKR